jgi:hypothetical protein
LKKLSINTLLINVRNATHSDIPSIINGIIKSDKTGGEEHSLTGLLGISELELNNILKLILQENYKGHELSLDSFFVAEINGKIIGTLSAWIEGIDAVSSSIIKASLLLDAMNNIGKKMIFNNLEKQRQLIPRKKNTIQIEYVYVCRNYRRMRVLSSMLKKVISIYNENNNVTGIQVILSAGNIVAKNAYSSLGFKVATTKLFNDLQNKYPEKKLISRISMEMNLI